MVRFIITTVIGGIDSINHSLSLLKPSRGFAILLNNYEFIVKVTFSSLFDKSRNYLEDWRLNKSNVWHGMNNVSESFVALNKDWIISTEV